MARLREMFIIEEKNFDSSDKIISKEEISSILELKGKERMDAILNRENAQELVQAMPEEEIYLTIKEIGEHDALPLISLMSPEQYQYLLDLEFWKKYELNPEKIYHWLPILLSCEEEAIERWLKSIDLDTLILTLKKNIRIHIRNNDEPLDFDKENYPIRLDGTYYIEVLNPSFREYIEKLINYLASIDFNFYLRLLDQVSWEIEAELEERAFRFREARLADKGFPSFDEAISLYQYLNPKMLKIMLEKREIPKIEISENSIPPNFPMLIKDQRMFFSICLGEVEDRNILDRIKMELSYMANQALVIDQPENIDLAVLQDSLIKVGAYLSIGLEILSGGDISLAGRYISEIPLKYIFQIGFGATLELKWKAEKIIKKGWFRDKEIPLSFLGHPWEDRMEGLLRKRPLFYSVNQEKGFREFRTLDEIRLVEHELVLIELLSKILSKIDFSYTEGLIWKTLLLNIFLDEAIKNSFQEKPLTYKEKIILLTKNSNDEANLKRFIENWILDKFHFIKNYEIELLREISNIIFEEIRSEKNILISLEEVHGSK